MLAMVLHKKDYGLIIHPSADLSQGDPLVITVDIANCEVRRCIVTTGASTNILYKTTFDELGLKHGI